MKYLKCMKYLSVLLIIFIFINTKRATAGAETTFPENNDFKRTNVYQVSGPELIAYNGKNLFVALGPEQSKTSADGKIWITHSIDLGKIDGSYVTLNDMTYGNKYYIAVGKGNHMMFSSKDGVKWKPVKLYKEDDKQNNSEIMKILWNGKEFSAIERTSTTKYIIWKSKDGVKWTSKKAQGIEDGFNLCSEKFYKGNYYIVGGMTSQYSSILSSKDGVVWKQIKRIKENELTDIAYNGEIYLVIGRNGYVLYSEDLKSWKERTDAFGDYLYPHKLLVKDGCFYVTTFNYNLRPNGNGLFLYKSSDGLNWEELIEPYFTGKILDEYIFHFKSINSFNNTLIATTNNNDIITSENGEKWVLQDKGIDGSHFNISDLSYVGGKYFATIGNSNCLEVSSSSVDSKPNPYILFVSDDGVKWEDYSDQSPGYMNEVFWDGTNYYSYAGGRNTNIYKSLDGYVWTTYNYTFLDHPIDFSSKGPYYNIKKIKYINNKYYLMISRSDENGYYDGLIYSSVDGVSWSYVNEILGHQIEDISYGNGIYVIIGNLVKDFSIIGSTVYTTESFDKIKVSYENKASYYYNSIIYDGSKFCFTCLESNITYLVVSSDGKKWKRNIVCNDGVARENGLASNGYFYAVTDHYLRLSADGVHWMTYNRLCKGSVACVLWDGEKWIVAGQDSIYTYFSK